MYVTTLIIVINIVESSFILKATVIRPPRTSCPATILEHPRLEEDLLIVDESQTYEHAQKQRARYKNA